MVWLPSTNNQGSHFYIKDKELHNAALYFFVVDHPFFRSKGARKYLCVDRQSP